MKTHSDVGNAPYGMNAVVKGNGELPSGVIYVLRNVKNEVNINSQNRLHPFYLVYMSDDGEVVIDHLSPKEMLSGKQMSFLSETINGLDDFELISFLVIK